MKIINKIIGVILFAALNFTNSGCSNKTNTDPIQEGAIKMAEMLCRSEKLTGNEKDDLEKQGEEFGYKIGSKYLLTHEDTAKFLKLIDEALKTNCK